MNDPLNKQEITMAEAIGELFVEIKGDPRGLAMLDESISTTEGKIAELNDLAIRCPSQASEIKDLIGEHRYTLGLYQGARIALSGVLPTKEERRIEKEKP